MHVWIVLCALLGTGPEHYCLAPEACAGLESMPQQGALHVRALDRCRSFAVVRHHSEALEQVQALHARRPDVAGREVEGLG